MVTLQVPSSLMTLPENALSGIDLDHASQATRPRVLVVDDDTDYIVMIKLILRNAGFDVAGAVSCQMALEKCEIMNPDVILLDLMMPEVDGFDTFTLLRERTSAPVIFISAASNQDYAVKSLEMGGEDYITKPFYSPEVVARIHSVLQRTPPSNRVNKYSLLGLSVNGDTHEVSYGDKTVRLLPLEFTLLSILAEYSPRNVAYEKVTKQIWGEDSPKRRTHLKTVVFALRKKLAVELNCPFQIVNYRSLGYQLVSNPNQPVY